MTQRVGSNRIANGAITLIKTESGSLAPYEFANAAFDQANTDVTNISITDDTYGNSTYIPVITVTSNGRINAVSTVAAAGGGGGGITTGKAIAMAIVFG